MTHRESLPLLAFDLLLILTALGLSFRAALRVVAPAPAPRDYRLVMSPGDPPSAGIQVRIDAANRLHLNQEPVGGLVELRDSLAARRTPTATASVVAHADALFFNVDAVLQTLRDQGCRQVAVSTVIED